MRFHKNKIYLRFIIYFLIFGFIVSVLTSIINYNVRFNNIANEIIENADHEVTAKKQLLKNYIHEIDNNIQAIIANKIFENYLASPTAKNRQIAENFFLGVARAHEHFFQVRYLDKDGYEDLRVEKEQNTVEPFSIEQDKLQDKSNRYYFKEAAVLQANQTYLSKLDLNIEHGKIETPLRPTLRISKPVYRNNVFSGIIIINVDMRYILNLLKQSPLFNIYIVDKDGYFLIHRKEGYSWSRYTGENRLLHKDFPNVVNKILSHDDFHSADINSFNLGDVLSNNEVLKLILQTKPEYMENLEVSNYRFAVFIALLIIAISVPTGLILAIQPTQLQEKLNKTIADNLKYIDIIDKYVITSSTNINGIITNVSTAMCNISGYGKNELIGQPHSLIKSGQMTEDVYKELWGKITKGKVWIGEMQNRKRNGEHFWLKATILPLYNENGVISGFTSVAENVTDKKVIEKISEEDKLTKVYNRVKLDAALEVESERAMRYEAPLSLVLIDVDYFKSTNDTFGHQAGDSVLVELAEILKTNVRRTDILGRWGGEEFMIICTHTDINGAIEMSEHLRNVIEKYPFKIVGCKTVSLGVTGFKAGDTTESFIKRADTALYNAKKNGRNRVEAES